MTRKPNSTPAGVLSAETTADPLALPSTNAENPSTLGTLGTTPPTNPSSLPTQTLQVARLTQAFGKKLVALGLAHWRKVKLKTGETGWALWFPQSKWGIDPETHELVPLGMAENDKKQA